MNQKEIGLFLKELRKEKGLTQEEVADYFNTTNRSISRWENGNTLPDITVLLELAKFYDIKIEELLEGKRNTQTSQKEALVTYHIDDKSHTIKAMKRILYIICIINLMIVSVFTLELSNAVKIVSFLSGGIFGLSAISLVFLSKQGQKIIELKKKLIQK